MNRGYHGARGAAPNDGIFIEAASTPGHPLNKLARRQGIPPEEICDFLRAERDYYESQGMESPWARIVHETEEAYEWNEHVWASSGGGGGGYGGRVDRRRRQQTARYNREVTDYNRELDGFQREVDNYHREMDQLNHNLDRFATLQQQQQQQQQQNMFVSFNTCKTASKPMRSKDDVGTYSVVHLGAAHHQKVVSINHQPMQDVFLAGEQQGPSRIVQKLSRSHSPAAMVPIMTH